VIRLTSVILILAILVSALFLSWPWNLVVVLCGAILEVGEIVWGRRLARRWRPTTGPETMVGETAVVVVPCRPSGQVRLHGELWEASCAAGADVGEAVRITALQDLTLVVEPAPMGPGQASSSGTGTR
jgi:membrane protein implicated in regulation of membrane protease activity